MEGTKKTCLTLFPKPTILDAREQGESQGWSIWVGTYIATVSSPLGGSITKCGDLL